MSEPHSALSERQSVHVESRSGELGFVRCPGCGALVAVSLELREGDLAECDAAPCLAEFYVYGLA